MKKKRTRKLLSKNITEFEKIETEQYIDSRNEKEESERILLTPGFGVGETKEEEIGRERKRKKIF